MLDKVDSGRLDPAELRHGLVSVQTAAKDAAELLKHPRNFTRPARDMADAIFGEMNSDSLRTGRQAIDAAVTKPLNLGMLLRVIVKAGSERGIDPPDGVAVEPVGSRYGARLAQSRGGLLPVHTGEGRVGGARTARAGSPSRRNFELPSFLARLEALTRLNN